MRRLMKVCLASLIGGIVMFPCLVYGREDISFEWSNAIYSKYIWRGQNLGDDWCYQPTITVGYKGLGLTLFANYNTVGNTDEWSELDFTVDYTTDLGFVDSSLEKVSVSLGYTYYTYPNISSNLPEYDSHEVYLGIGADVFLSPTLTVYYDFDTGDGVYYEAGISHSFDVGKCTISPSLSLGYNDGQWGYDPSFSSLLIGVNTSIPVGEYFTVEPMVAESVALDDQYEDEFYGGVNFTISY